MVIKTAPSLQKHFETMPLKFNTQQTNNGCVFTYKNTIVSNELFYTLRQYGSSIEVISPDGIRQKMKEDSKKLISIYDD